jgi:hypothetical protein
MCHENSVLPGWVQESPNRYSEDDAGTAHR